MTISATAILARIIDKIEKASIDPQPSDNIYMEGLFAPEVYKEILSRLPPREAYDPIVHIDANLPDGRTTRDLLDLTDSTLSRFPSENRDFWRVMKDVFVSGKLQNAILQKFHASLKARFGDVWPEMVTVPVFYKDYPGYFINIHPDADWKVATFQLYLPVDESQIHLGTSFHLLADNEYRLHKTNLFKPASGYAFVRTDHSWHSVQKMGVNESERNTLALTVYIKGREYKSGERYV